MTDDELYNLPKVLVYSDGSFGLDELTGADFSNYRLGYYEVPKVINPLFANGNHHEVDSSEFYMDFEDFEAYRDIHGPKEFMDDYGKDAKDFKPMMYREQ